MPDGVGLIGAIHDAAVDPALWPGAMAQLVRATGAQGGIIYAHDHATRKVQVIGAHGIDPDSARQYERYYGALDPWHRRGGMLPVGTLAQTASFVRDDELRRTEFYQDYLRRQDLFYAMGGPVERTRDYTVVFGVQRGHRPGVFAPETEALVRNLVPHLRRACRLRAALGRLRQETAELEALFDLLDRAVFVVDREGRLLRANGAGAALLRGRDLLRQFNGRLHPADRRDAGAFRRALGAEATAADPGLLALRRTGGPPARVQVVPLRSRNRAEWTGRLALLVELPAPPGGFARVMAACRVSPAERRLWHALAAGWTLAEFGEANAVSINTLRIQLASLFRKTGVHRQADLVRLAHDGARVSPAPSDNLP